MKRTWVVVMDRMGARLFERQARKKELALVKEWGHSEGDLKEGELTADRPGKARMPQQEFGSNSLSPSGSAKEESLKKFCKQVGKYLNIERTTDHYDELILVAEPRTLGTLKSSLNSQVSKMITSTVDKDFAWIETEDISDIVMDYI